MYQLDEYASETSPSRKTLSQNQGRLHMGRRLSFSGSKGGPCWKVTCQKPGASWFNTRNKQYYCDSCASIINGTAKINREEEPCIKYECVNTKCGFYHTKCALNCDAWGLHIEGAEKMTPVVCIKKQRLLIEKEGNCGTKNDH